MKFLYKASLLIFISCVPLFGYSQPSNFSPLPSYSKSSKNLISHCNKLYNEALDSIDYLYSDTYHEVKKIYNKSTTLLIEKINNNAFVYDRELETLVRSIKLKLENYAQLEKRERLVLIEKNPQVNALCLGNGVFIINVGLIARIKNEDQLAFVIAHEFAHYELEHVRDKAIKYVELKSKEKEHVNISFNKSTITFDRLSSLNSLREILYLTSNLSREDELEADSLALIYLNQAGYNVHEATNAITTLEKSTQPQYPLGQNLFSLFDYPEYQFNYDWLRPKLSVYNKKPTSVFIFQLDSLKTHPAYENRREQLSHLIKTLSIHTTIRPKNISSEIIKSEFETVEAAKYKHQLDASTYYAMQLYNIYPESDYLRNRIAKNLLLIYDSKIKDTFNSVVAPYIGNYSEELKLINTFLYNLRIHELSQIIYHFVKTERSESNENEEYYALWYKACSINGYKKEAKEVAKEYESHFPDSQSIKYYYLK